eukprot:TRINITY_DN52134_c0_g1_i1.p1 TRINITY_DN52134_c0_g1~~TRINITY_DN52134_c0_g1_i1.p1  ORF type:complete len:224 (-),score=41.97 TRINITY_DN52134_c0_g1_i1:72-668(-)
MATAVHHAAYVGCTPSIVGDTSWPSPPARACCRLKDGIRRPVWQATAGSDAAVFLSADVIASQLETCRHPLSPSRSPNASGAAAFAARALRELRELQERGRENLLAGKRLDCRIVVADHVAADMWTAAVAANPLRQRVQEIAGMKSLPAVLLDGSSEGAPGRPGVVVEAIGTRPGLLFSGNSFEEVLEQLERHRSAAR